MPADAHPDKATVPEELADDAKKFGRFAEVVTDPAATVKDIRRTSLELRREIQETETLAVRQRARRP